MTQDPSVELIEEHVKHMKKLSERTSPASPQKFCIPLNIKQQDAGGRAGIGMPRLFIGGLSCFRRKHLGRVP